MSSLVEKIKEKNILKFGRICQNTLDYNSSEKCGKHLLFCRCNNWREVLKTERPDLFDTLPEYLKDEKTTKKNSTLCDETNCDFTNTFESGYKQCKTCKKII